ncbi:hypothetical protein [Erythrobacter sp. JK5]|uniref:hypothetical protein n=1 Tax=Erythrobacter sp. JK5 TaxID=2829500 RepID=UPI001BABBD44|nr:hypothetical protein [Erythrobacter sp. JK5]QUL36753.1 hypothetical protein KDC96_10020 [Erythrobacter sp. JK5]
MNRIKIFSDVFPYLAIPVLVYNLVAFFSGDAAPGGPPAILATIDATVVSVPMLSGVTLQLSWADMLVALAVAFLFIEVVKATSTASAGIINHMLSMLLFIICLMEFVVLESFATAPFFIITLIVLLDALAGMVVTIVSARRDFGVEGIGA